MTALLQANVPLRVDEIGPMCPLRVGELVRTTGRATFDFLAGGEVIAFEIVRKDGSRYMVTRGPRGARFMAWPERGLLEGEMR